MTPKIRRTIKTTMMSIGNKMLGALIFRETKIGFSQIMIIGILLVVPSLLPYASAEITVDWTVAGLNNFVTSMNFTEGNLDFGSPVSVQVTDTDTSFNDAAIDTIDIIITSTLDSAGTTLTLTETGVNTNTFFGDTLSYEGNFVMISDPSLRLSISDTVTVQLKKNFVSGCGFGDTITELDSVNDSTGVFVYSDTEVENGNDGIGLILTETGPNTCTFEATITFTDTGPSDVGTGTLHVSEGDIITFLNEGSVSSALTNAQIIPTVDGKGSIVAEFDDPDLGVTKVIATYLGVSANLAFDDPIEIPGGGGGGLKGPIIVVDSGNGGGGSTDLGNGGDNQWDTRPTFGISHEDRQNQVVENGFSFNSEKFTLTDNHHTDFAEQSVDIGTVNSFSATVYADKKLKIQEFLFGIPNVGEAHLAELGVEVWYDNNGEIEDVKVVQNSDVIDVDTVSVTHEKVKCIPTDAEARCDTTTVSMIFLEPLIDKVMAVKAVDYALRDQRTYLNDGFDISGDSLNPMNEKMIPSNVKNQGLLKVTQMEKYSPYWTSEDGRMFEMNSFGSFKEINQSFERFQDTGNAFTRVHSGFGGIIQYEQKRATLLFDSSNLISELPESFAYIYPETGHRMSDDLKQEMFLQELLAKEILDGMVQPQRNY